MPEFLPLLMVEEKRFETFGWESLILRKAGGEHDAHKENLSSVIEKRHSWTMATWTRRKIFESIRGG